ncbi:MAG TPA: MCE family protein [Acidimicrobiales bacterium]|nr:MCE family protein [Acidimicrobiales bacterium]
MTGFAAIRGRRRRAGARLGAVALAGLAASVLLGGCGPGSYTFSAVFATGQGIFPGSHVQVLGLDVGTVESVRNAGDSVVVTMSMPVDHPLPADVKAIMVAPELLGQRSVDLEPGYTGGPRLHPGAVIPRSRTSVPVETNQILREVTNYLEQIDPGKVHDVVTNLATIMQGQGQQLNRLIHNAAGTVQLLADKGDELGRLEGSLAQLTGTLDSRSSAIQALVRDYDTVSGVVAQQRDALDGAIRGLSQASSQLAQLLSPNLSGLQQDLSVLTTAGRTVDRNLDSVDKGLASSVRLFTAAQRAYDPTRQWLNLNNQSPPGTVSTVVDDELRDRLAGVCRRLLANHSQGLSPSEVQTLKQCGNPSSGFFDPILGAISQQAGAGGTTQAQSPQQAFSKGLAAIPGLTPGQRQSLAQSGPNLPAPTTTTPTLPAPTTTTSTTLLPPLGPPPTIKGPGLLGALAGHVSAAGHDIARFLWGWV